MRPYDPDVICPKCGCEDIGTYYEKAGKHGEGFCTGSGMACEGAPEFIARTCRRCHFGWRESPLKAGVLGDSG